MINHFIDIKFEILNPKFETNPKFEYSNVQNSKFRLFGFRSFENCFGFRYSDFGFNRLFRNLLQIIILVTGYWLLVTSSYAQPISSTELIEQAKDYDGKTVMYRGEVIGEVMVRGDYAWVNVSDGENAIGIWAKVDLINLIAYKGDYKHIGDRIEVLGVFQRACPQHGGDLDIHAQEIIKIAEGREIKLALNPQKKKLTIYLGVALLCLLILRILK